jgi:hypothetical protein
MSVGEFDAVFVLPSIRVCSLTAGHDKLKKRKNGFSVLVVNVCIISETTIFSQRLFTLCGQ